MGGGGCSLEDIRVGAGKMFICKVINLLGNEAIRMMRNIMIIKDTCSVGETILKLTLREKWNFHPSAEHSVIERNIDERNGF